MDALKRLIKEQFNINDLDFGDDDQGYDAGIFNKNIIDISNIYKKLINNALTGEDVFLLNQCI